MTPDLLKEILMQVMQNLISVLPLMRLRGPARCTQIAKMMLHHKLTTIICHVPLQATDLTVETVLFHVITAHPSTSCQGRAGPFPTMLLPMEWNLSQRTYLSLMVAHSKTLLRNYTILFWLYVLPTRKSNGQRRAVAEEQVSTAEEFYTLSIIHGQDS